MGNGVSIRLTGFAFHSLHSGKPIEIDIRALKPTSNQRILFISVPEPFLPFINCIYPYSRISSDKHKINYISNEIKKNLQKGISHPKDFKSSKHTLAFSLLTSYKCQVKYSSFLHSGLEMKIGVDDSGNVKL